MTAGGIFQSSARILALSSGLIWLSVGFDGAQAQTTYGAPPLAAACGKKDPFGAAVNCPVARADSASNPADASRFYGGAEFLMWGVKGAPLSVPLVSSGPPANKNGFLVNSNTTILYGAPFSPATGGNDTQNFPMSPGTRLTVGYWLDPAHMYAIEASGFVLQRQTTVFTARGDGTGTRGIRVPVFNSQNYFAGGGCDPAIPSTCVIGPQEDGVPVVIIGNVAGSVSVTNSLGLWGADAVGITPLYRGPSWELYGLAGVRYLDLSESFNLTVNIVGLANTFYAGQSGTSTDLFETRNQFYGATVGLRGRYFSGPFSLEVTGRIALGVSHEVLNVAGFYRDFNAPFTNTSGPFGTFAMPANEGVRSANNFAMVPEVQAKLGFDITPSIRLTVGGDFLYYSSVVRPGDQINRNLPKGQTFQQDTSTPTSTSSPAPLFRPTDFYAEGFNVGVAVRF